MAGFACLTFAFSRGGVIIAPAAVGCNALLAGARPEEIT
jgi:hypothetical protein